MRPIVRSVLAPAAVLAMFLPHHLSAQNGPVNYIQLTGGVYFPTGDLKTLLYDPSATLELAYGRHFHENFVLEFAGGLLHAEGGSDSTVQLFFRDRDLITWYGTLTPKAVYTQDRLELFGGGGVGAYYVNLELYDRTPGSPDFKEKQWMFGAHAVAGFGFAVTPFWQVGFDGQFLWTEQKVFTNQTISQPVELVGFKVRLNIKLRF